MCQGCILSPRLFNLYAEYVMRNAGLEEAQAEIKIAGRNINNLRYADDTTLMAESKAELMSLLMKVQEESEKVALKLNIQKTKIMASDPITSWQIDGKTAETVTDLILGGSKITAAGDCSHEIKWHLLLGRKAMTNLDSFLFFYLFILFYILTLQYCIGFAIYQNESATCIHVVPILNPPPSSLPIPVLWVIPVHQPQASSIGHQTWTGDSFHI